MSSILTRECGEIGRHDGLKIHCLVISVRVQVPPFLKNKTLRRYSNEKSRFISYS